MKDNFAEQAESLRTAIDTEKAGYRFYRLAAGQTGDPEGRKTFERLAKDEMEHIGVLATLFAAVEGGEPWMTYREAVERQGPTPAGEIIFSEEPDGSRERFSDVEALREALGIEERAVRFYRERAAKAHDEKASSFYRSLVEMEEGHVKIVQAEIDSLTGTGIWLGYQEISLED